MCDVVTFLECRTINDNWLFTLFSLVTWNSLHPLPSKSNRYCMRIKGAGRVPRERKYLNIGKPQPLGGKMATIICNKTANYDTACKSLDSWSSRISPHSLGYQRFSGSRSWNLAILTTSGLKSEDNADGNLIKGQHTWFLHFVGGPCGNEIKNLRNFLLPTHIAKTHGATDLWEDVE
jgi:hypothetical protein